MTDDRSGAEGYSEIDRDTRTGSSKESRVFTLRKLNAIVLFGTTVTASIFTFINTVSNYKTSTFPI